MKSSKRIWVLAQVSFMLMAMGLPVSCAPEEEESPLSEGQEAVRGKAVLPNWATPEELLLEEQAARVPTHLRLRGSPPSGVFHVPAEFEPTMAVVMTWAGYTSMLQAIAKGVAASGAMVWAVGGPSSLSGVAANRYESLGYAYDSVWTRDYGPFGIDEATGKLGIIDPTYRHYAARPDDDAIPCQIAKHAGAPCYSTSLVLDGGNFLTDGQGNLFMTSRIYTWNSGLSRDQVDKLLKDYFGVQKLHVFDYAQSSAGVPADGTGHIDMFVKLLSPCKVLIAKSTSAAFQQPLEKAATYFAGLTCPAGKPYEIYRINGYSSGGTWYTYTNSLIVNNTVIIPSYASGDNATAKQIYEQALPGYTILPVASDSSITAGGSIHCVTKEVPAITAVPTPDPEPEPNQAPAAQATTASPTAAPGALVTLDGSGSADPDGDALSYQWAQLQGPAVALSDPRALKPTFSAPSVTADTTLAFQLVVSDGQLSSAAAQVSVVVKNVADPTTLETKSADTPMAIPDSNTTGIKSNMAISSSGKVRSLQVTVNVTHPYPGALRIRLTCPSGTQTTLQSYSGSGTNIHKTYAVSTCNGQSVQGTWTLTVDDRDGYNDKGTLGDWSVKIETTP